MLFIINILALSVTAAEKKIKVELKTNYGSIILELDEEKAPITVKNFITYVEENFYDGLIFHRVIDGFMIQGGGFDKNYQQKKTNPPIKNEANNGLSNSVGTISMARTNSPNSATGQFFINVNNNDFLNYSQSNPGYAVFGKVVEGMSVVEKIKTLKTGSGGPFPTDVPQELVIIEAATIKK